MHATLASIQIFLEGHHLIGLQQTLFFPNIQASSFPMDSFRLRNYEGLMQQ
uniref:Uncharacterized protein n=1 Tax=Arundo donax TaxID=35708 RepID=A0A0A9FP54_ARUDO